MMFVLLIIMAGLFLGSCSPGEAPPRSTGEQQPASPSLDGRLPYYRLPDKVSFCGEPVPLNDPAVREALDREFIIVVWRREQTIMWLKRAQRYFPEITRKLKDKGLPQDLKYVLVVESSFLLKARSSAGALGPWQFMEPTAKRFLLKTNQVIDERLDFAASTDAALKYLKELHRLFHNWPLALAAYNAGEGRVKKAMADQGVKNYYHLSLPEETERYLFRILAVKIVMEDPVKYGYVIPPESSALPGNRQRGIHGVSGRDGEASGRRRRHHLPGRQGPQPLDQGLQPACGDLPDRPAQGDRGQVS